MHQRVPCEEAFAEVLGSSRLHWFKTLPQYFYTQFFHGIFRDNLLVLECLPLIKRRVVVYKCTCEMWPCMSSPMPQYFQDIFRVCEKKLVSYQTKA